MKLKIILACALGMSTAVLVKRVREAAVEAGYEIECEAYSVNVVGRVAGDADCVLLGPQADFLLKKIQAELPDVPVSVTNMRDYGTMNGANVFAQALSVIRERKGGKRDGGETDFSSGVGN